MFLSSSFPEGTIGNSGNFSDCSPDLSGSKSAASYIVSEVLLHQHVSVHSKKAFPIYLLGMLSKVVGFRVLRSISIN